jgi:hypothetical protein
MSSLSFPMGEKGGTGRWFGFRRQGRWEAGLPWWETSCPTAYLPDLPGACSSHRHIPTYPGEHKPILSPKRRARTGQDELSTRAVSSIPGSKYPAWATTTTRHADLRFGTRNTGSCAQSRRQITTCFHISFLWLGWLCNYGLFFMVRISVCMPSAFYCHRSVFGMATVTWDRVGSGYRKQTEDVRISSAMVDGEAFGLHSWDMLVRYDMVCFLGMGGHTGRTQGPLPFWVFPYLGHISF